MINYYFCTNLMVLSYPMVYPVVFTPEYMAKAVLALSGTM